MTGPYYVGPSTTLVPAVWASSADQAATVVGTHLALMWGSQTLQLPSDERDGRWESLVITLLQLFLLLSGFWHRGFLAPRGLASIPSLLE